MRYAIRSLIAVSVLVLSSAQSVLPASAYYYSGVTRARINSYHNSYHYHRRPVTLHEYFHDHPKVKAATVGAGVGAVAGGVTGLVTGRGIARGALIGAGTGAGVGLIRSSHIMRRHPIMRDIATGGAIGGGFGWAAGHHGGGSIGKGLLIGGAAGLGVGLLRHAL